MVPMQQTFTQNDLVKYLYAETDIVQSFMIEQQMGCDYPFKEDYNCLKKSKDLLNGISLSPSQASVDFILAYGDLYQPKESKVVE